jgi:hypothetical protein
VRLQEKKPHICRRQQSRKNLILMLLRDQDLKELTVLNEREYQENSDTAADRPQLTNNALKKRLQIVDDVITSSRLTISDIHASNLSTR